MKNSLLICDEANSLTKESTNIIFWKRVEIRNKSEKNIYELIEKDPSYYKNKYLEFVHQLQLSRVNTGNNRVKLLNLFKLDNEFSIWWLTNVSEKENYEKIVNINEIIKCLALENYITQFEIDKIFLDLKNKQTVEVISNLCKKKGINYQVLSGKKEIITKENTELYLSKIIFSLIIFIIKIFKNWSFKNVGIKHWKSSKAKLLFVSYLSNFNTEPENKEKLISNYWGHLTEELDRKGIKTNWINLYTKNNALKSEGIAAKKIEEINRKSEHQTHVCLFSFINLVVIRKTLFDWIRILNSFAKTSFPRAIFKIKNSELNIWPLFKKDLENSFQGRELILNILMFHLFKSSLSMLPQQRKGFFLQENNPWEFSFLHSWKKNLHKEVFGVPHATVSYWDLRYFFYKKTYSISKKIKLLLPNKVIVNGKDMKEKFIEGGYPKNRLIKAEAIRYLDLKNKKKGVFKKFGNKLKILIALDISKKIYEKQLEFAARLVKENKNYKVIICAHPSSFIKLKNVKNISELFDSTPFAKLLDSVDIVITSNITSAAVDAYLTGVPVITYIGSDMLNFSPLKENKEVKFASNFNQIKEHIKFISKKKYVLKKNKNYFLLDRKLKIWKRITLN